MIIGNRLTLRAIERDDLPQFVRWLNDVDVARTLTTYLPLSLDDETDWYEAQRKDSSALNLAMEQNEPRQLIGTISLMGIDYREQNAELGLFIGDKTQWNKGYCQEAIRLLLTYAFQTLNLHRVQLRVLPSNPGGLRCYQKVGFSEEGRMREATYINGQFEDIIMMSILRTEYPSVEASPQERLS